ncbi:hypothetical protein BKA62DRAFT_463898 [Auriculariales sp. MPI-PUGE-AT-0066]|nr:hypothetical protein BKA62DRAFT_463898 [Auriculariales sp. MPI-PUGE-AT-0066]
MSTSSSVERFLSQLPSQDEIKRISPPKWTWLELKQFTDSGDLGQLKRHPDLEILCRAWSDRVCAEHGTLANFVKLRLGWNGAPPPPSGFFALDNPPDTWQFMKNSWPYCIPHEVQHTLVWTRLPILNPNKVQESMRGTIVECGMWGFAGGAEAELPARGEDTERGSTFIGTGEQAKAVRAAVAVAGADVQAFVQKHWPEDAWEVAWFVNPPRLQSIADRKVTLITLIDINIVEVVLLEKSSLSNHSEN